jgi:hypothetical protein
MQFGVLYDRLNMNTGRLVGIFVLKPYQATRMQA